MVSSTHRFVSPCYPTTRKRANLHFGFGVQGNAEGFCVLLGLCVDLPQVIEDRVGFRDFF